MLVLKLQKWLNLEREKKRYLLYHHVSTVFHVYTVVVYNATGRFGMCENCHEKTIYCPDALGLNGSEKKNRC